MKTDITANLKLQAMIKQRKPAIAESTMKTYASLLKSMFYRHHAKEEPLNLEWFENTDTILDDIKTQTLSSRRPILSSILAITNDNQLYKDYLMELGEGQKKIDDSQIMTPKQEDNWEDFSEVKSIFKKIKDASKPLFKSKSPLDKTQYETCLNFIILSLTTGTLFSPRRSLDWTEMKVRNFDLETDNYIDFENRQFVFNKYKTSKKYGEQKIDIPSKLMKTLNRWVRLTPENEYLLTSHTRVRVSVSRLTQLINKIFGKNISTSMLRHIFLTNLYENIPSIREMNQTADAMGHSRDMALQYVKKVSK